MTKYKVTIRTTHEATFTVEAEDKGEAYEIAYDEFKNKDTLGDIAYSEAFVSEIKEEE